VSNDPTNGASKIQPSKGHDEGGGAGKWLLGGLAAVVLLGGGYYAFKSMTPADTTTEIAYNDENYADEPLRAGALDANDETVAESAASDEAPAPRAASSGSRAASQPARRASSDAAYVPEETIGITPVSTSVEDEEVVVRAPVRPVWTRTPTTWRLSQLYPRQALERGREGEARLACTVEYNGALACARSQQTSDEFGDAAMRVARTLRHAPQRSDGSDAAGTPVNLRVVFRTEEDRHG